MNKESFRSLQSELVKYYELDIVDYKPITLKTYKLSDNNGNLYFLKKTNEEVLTKYQYLESFGLDNILYPELNNNKNFITKVDNISFYINKYYNTYSLNDDIKAYYFFDELSKIHYKSSFRKTLDSSKSRPKFEELTSQLDYKFKILESYIRRIEANSLKTHTITILENYHYILDIKKELIKLQKRIISSVKAKESVKYSVIHNNPSIDHLLNIRGSNYLTSFDNAKIGIDSLDVAKFYIENNGLNLDFKKLIIDKYYSKEELFSYDYFRFLVLVIYIKSINLSNYDYINATIFENIAEKIKKYFEDFLDYKEETSNPD